MLFIMSLNFAERGIREIKDDPKRAQAAQDLAKKCGCEIKQVYLTSGEYDLVQIIETTNADSIAKYALSDMAPIYSFALSDTVGAISRTADAPLHLLC